MELSALKKIFRNANSKKYIATVFIAGILIMTFSAIPQKPEAYVADTEKKDTYETEKNDTQDPSDMEKKLKALFENIEGAGKVEVMVTYKSGPEKIVATDTVTEENSTNETGSDGTEKINKSISGQVNTVIIDGRSQNDSGALIIKEKTPEIEGIVVVAQGGDSANVKNAISKAAQALFDIPAHKVEVLKMGE